jgi:hypothetical protein
MKATYFVLSAALSLFAFEIGARADSAWNGTATCRKYPAKSEIDSALRCQFKEGGVQKDVTHHMTPCAQETDAKRLEAKCAALHSQGSGATARASQPQQAEEVRKQVTPVSVQLPHIPAGSQVHLHR